MPKIPLRRRDGTIAAVAVVDQEDYDSLGHLRWHLGHRGYVQRMYTDPSEPAPKRQRLELLHRRILSPPSHLEVDHIDGDRLNNRRSNLRAVTRGQNEQNKSRRPGSSGISNVYWSKDPTRKGGGRWVACVKVAGKKHVRAGFASKEEAAIAAQELRRLWHPFAP